MTGEDLKELRGRAELTQQEMANHLGVSISGYCGWEAGRQRIPDLTAIGIKEKMKPLISEKAA